MKRERIFTRLHTVKLWMLSNKAMKISEAVLLMILVVNIVLSAFAVTGSATSRTGDPAKLEYAGLVSRNDKFLSYMQGGYFTWSYKGAPVYCHSAYYYCLEYLYPRDKYKNVNEYLTAEGKEISDFYYTEFLKTGMPLVYYYVRKYDIPRAEFESLFRDYIISRTEEGPLGDKRFSLDEAVKIFADAIYSDDGRVAMETFLEPGLVINPVAFASDTPKAEKFISYQHDNEEMWMMRKDLFVSYGYVLDASVETLETWNYSDEYWYDYYSFLTFAAKYGESPYGNDYAYISESDEDSAEIARRLAIYAQRLGKSPDTGDEKGERAVMFAAGAVVAAAVPAAIVTLARKRRKDKEQD